MDRCTVLVGRISILASALMAGFAISVQAAPPCEVRAADVSFFRDNGLSVKLGARLQFNRLLANERINAKVSGGVAILSGNVSARGMITAARTIAADTGGIRCVQNYLKVGPPLPEPARQPY